MTPRQFTKIATSFPGAVEAEHMGHPDFRVAGKIFSSLNAVDGELGMVKLTPSQQAAYLETDSDVFRPCSGAWGKSGCTHIVLSLATPKLARSALELAFENIVEGQPKRTKSKSKTEGEKVVGKPSNADFKNDSEAVSAFLVGIDHPLMTIVELIRETILKLDPRIREGIKWNSASFHCHGWFATCNMRTKENILLVLHHGAKLRSGNSLSTTIRDESKLLNWLGSDRATVSFKSLAEFKKAKRALKLVIQQWVEYQVQNSSKEMD